jgi:hypothetical protein
MQVQVCAQLLAERKQPANSKKCFVLFLTATLAGFDHAIHVSTGKGATTRLRRQGHFYVLQFIIWTSVFVIVLNNC